MSCPQELLFSMDKGHEQDHTKFERGITGCKRTQRKCTLPNIAQGPGPLPAGEDLNNTAHGSATLLLKAGH